MNKRAAQITMESGNPLMAVLVATLEAGFESGLVDPLHISVEWGFFRLKLSR